MIAELDVRASPAPVGCSSEQLQVWLEWIERIHPLDMDFTLDRAQAVADRLGITKPAPKVVTVAGTNGKGSTVRLLEAALVSASVRVGVLASPHLFQFNERIRLNADPASDEDIVRAFQAVEAARCNLPLTYYEYGVLAAFWLMCECGVDIALLEVGLGGRLDTVNLVDADVAVVTQVGIDHTSILGEDREAIGLEKAGIFRAQQLAIIGDPTPPSSVLEKAKQLQVDVRLRGVDFRIDSASGKLLCGDCVLPLRSTFLSIDNVLTALAVLHYGCPEVALDDAYRVMCKAALPGRLQAVDHQIWLDVGHNPDCARHLAQELPNRIGNRRLYCLYATLADKDASGFVSALEHLVAGWYLGATRGPRRFSAEQLAQQLAEKDIKMMAVDEDFESIFRVATAAMTDADALLICGSFDCVAQASNCLEQI